MASRGKERVPVPTWVIAKTVGQVRTSPKRRRWWRTKIRA